MRGGGGEARHFLRAYGVGAAQGAASCWVQHTPPHRAPGVVEGLGCGGQGGSEGQGLA